MGNTSRKVVKLEKGTAKDSLKVKQSLMAILGVLAIFGAIISFMNGGLEGVLIAVLLLIQSVLAFKYVEGTR